MRNKQRKAKKKAELENAQAAKAEKKKEQYNKSRQQQNQDGDPEAPVLDELIPEKLARPDDPLGKAIDFLKPLQLLSSRLIETQLWTFEIYYRKNKLLIMLQALKRAFAIDPNNATLHGCIVRFIKLLDKKLAVANEFVRIVIQREMETELPIIGRRSCDLNDEFVAKNKGSADALIAGARVYYDDSPDNKTKAIELLMSCTHLKSFTLEVSYVISLTRRENLKFLFHLQHAQFIYSLFKRGDFGSAEKETEKFLERSRELYHIAVDFKPFSGDTEPEVIDTNDDAKSNAN